jgi:hypothetical protein
VTGALARRALRTALGVAAGLLLAAPVWADEKEPALLALGLGYYDIHQQDDEAADFRLEYRSDLALWIFRPWLGLEVTSDGAVYGLGGFLADIALGPRVRLTPSLGAGAYHNGDGKDLGHAVQFRSQIELGYRFESGQRLAIAFSHISNASLSNQNPGTEILTLYYMVPLDLLF